MAITLTMFAAVAFMQDKKLFSSAPNERIDIPETQEEWLSKQDFHNGADQSYMG